ncbi:MAG: hypothetical protein R3D66_00750 [Alphaproteobacteria bacterium]
MTETAQTPAREIGGAVPYGLAVARGHVSPADDQCVAKRARGATNGLVDQLYSLQAALTLRVLRDTAGKAAKGESLLQTWTALQNGKVERLEPLFEHISGMPTVDLLMLITAEQRSAARILAGD